MLWLNVYSPLSELTLSLLCTPLISSTEQPLDLKPWLFSLSVKRKGMGRGKGCWQRPRTRTDHCQEHVMYPDTVSELP